jgi:hypothetical protein
MAKKGSAEPPVRYRTHPAATPNRKVAGRGIRRHALAKIGPSAIETAGGRRDKSEPKRSRVGAGRPGAGLARG